MNNNQIDKTSYYQLPCGKFLEDFIYYKNLNFNMGSALKYKWRAGNKDGESDSKDLAKADHYIRFEALCRHRLSGSDKFTNSDELLNDLVESIRDEIDFLMEEARQWAG